MVSIFGHRILGYTIVKVLDRKRIKWLVVVAILSVMLPYIDIIAFKLEFI